MRKMKVIVAAAVVGLGFAGMAQAAPVLSAQLAAIQPPSSTATGAKSGYSSFVVSIVSDIGQITAADFSTGANGVTSGGLVQRWTYDEDAEDFVQSPKSTQQGANSTNSANLDSHWLQGGALNVTIAEPGPATENQTAFFGSAQGWPNAGEFLGGARYGTGTAMDWTFALDPSSQNTNVPLAYIVIPDTGSATFSGQVTVLGDPTPHPVSITVAVPEPASMGMLAVAACGLLGRRRRA